MPIGAENIGTAYVRVIADGKDFDLAKALRGHEGDGEMAGRRLSDKYQEGFRDEWGKAPNREALRDSIYKSLISGDAAKKFTGTKNFQDFKSGVTKEFGDIGKRAAQNLEEELNSGRLDLSGLQGRVDKFSRELVKAEDQLNREAVDSRRKYLDEAYRDNVDFNKRKLRLQQLGAAQSAAIVEDETRTLKEAYFIEDQLRKKKQFAVQRDIEMQRHLALVTRAYALKEKIEKDESAKSTDHLTERMAHYRNTLNKVADLTGVAFGKGSRNNFLNFVGSVAGNIVRLGANIVDLAGHVRSIGRVFAEAGGGIAGFRAILKPAEKGLLGLGSGIAGLFVLVGPLTSILSGLGGMILALASSAGAAALGALSSFAATLAVGIGGGAAIAAGALLPLIAGAGVLALAIKNTDKETKKSFKSIKDEFTKLGQAASKSTFANIAEQSAKFKDIIGGLTPIVRNVGTALSQVGDAWLKMADGPGFARFQADVGKFLPGAVKDLGIALGNALGGIGGLFRAVLPETGRFLDYIKQITKNFNEFTNSARGQKVLSDFFTRAADSAALLGGFLSAVRSLLVEVFDQANAQGDGLFRSMTDGIKGFTAALHDNPDIFRGWVKSMMAFGRFAGSLKDLLVELVSAGKDVGDSLFGSLADRIDGFVKSINANPDILGNWYKSAGEFARALGDILLGLGKVFSALDNTFSRSVLTSTFKILAGVISGVAAVLDGIARSISALFGAGEKGAEGILRFGGEVAAATILMGLFNKSLVVTSITKFISNMQSAETRTVALGGAAKSLAGGVGLALLASSFADASNKGDSFGTVMKGVAGGAGIGAMFGPIGALVGGAAGGGLSALVGAFAETKSEAVKTATELAKTQGFAEAKAAADTLRIALDGVKNAYGNVTRSAIEASFTGKDGKLSSDIALLRSLGVSMDTIVSATLGRADAIRQVDAALASGGNVERQRAIETQKAYEDAEAAAHRKLETTHKLTAQETDDLETLRQAALKASADQEAATGRVSAAQEVFRKRISGTTTEVKAQVAQMRDLAKQLGISVKTYKEFPSRVRTDFEARGLPQTASDTLRLIDRYKVLQNYKSIKSLVEATGVVLTTAQVKNLKRQYDLTPKQVRTLVGAVGVPQTKQSLEGLINSAKELDRQRPTPKVTVDPGNSAAVVANLRGALEGLHDKTVTIYTAHIDRGGPATAMGGVFSGAQQRTIGEAGPEAVVPLARNLSMVDPSVRWLSAIAQGKMASGGIGGLPQKSISADGWTIISNSKDPEAVARETFNRLVASGY